MGASKDRHFFILSNYGPSFFELLDNGIPAKLRHIRVIKRKSLGVSKSPRLSDGSGRRGSNSRPSAWEADALPTELLPQFGPFFKRGCKDITFCDMPYSLLIIFSASSAEIGENRLITLPSLSIDSSNISLGLTQMLLSPYMA